MSEIQRSFTDTSGKLPDATKRLNDVSHATEMATHEIMDKLELMNNGLDKVSEAVDGKNKEIIDTLKNDVMDITFALQFQDITSQKLEHANRILEAINNKFMELSKNSELIKVKTKVGERIMHELHLGPDPDRSSQDSDDFHKKTEDVIREDQSFSQDDIDALFD
jgi:chemotaxis regulatin CheY-phosphate phosphatase CheZ